MSKRRFYRRFEKPKRHERARINGAVDALQVRLIGESGQQLGVVPNHKALSLAVEAGLDLVEIAPNADPPVCKIMDYSKFKYLAEKKEKEARKKQKVIHVKTIKIRPKIDTHDYECKRNHIEKFLEHGDRVKVTVMFRGREMSRAKEFGRQVLDRIFADLDGKVAVESAAKFEGRNLSVVFSPIIKK